jgi:hypothetical protein
MFWREPQWNRDMQPSANLGWFCRLHQTSAVWHSQYLICVSALHLWFVCWRFTASDKHNALVVLKILKGYKTHTRLLCIYSLNLIDYHISYYCISIILVWPSSFYAAPFVLKIAPVQWCITWYSWGSSEVSRVSAWYDSVARWYIKI